MPTTITFADTTALLDGRPIGDVTEVRVDNTYDTLRSSSPERDPGWRYVDAAGHSHRWATRGGLRWPGVRVTTPESGGWCDRCQDHHEDGEVTTVEYLCALCGEALSPGTRMPEPVNVLTSTSTEVDVTADPVAFVTDLRLAARPPSDEPVGVLSIRRGGDTIDLGRAYAYERDVVNGQVRWLFVCAGAAELRGASALSG